MDRRLGEWSLGNGQSICGLTRTNTEATAAISVFSKPGCDPGSQAIFCATMWRLERGGGFC